jgi:mannose-1-phosphate guanylyltransferase / mannose-6-phosphate isomerase
MSTAASASDTSRRCGHAFVVLSREQYPKQLIDLLGGDTLLQATVRRTEGLAASHAMAAPIVVCGSEHRFATVQQLRGYGADASFILEPMRRNTAPALTLARRKLTDWLWRRQ